MSVESIAFDPGSPGRVFKLDEESIVERFQWQEAPSFSPQGHLRPTPGGIAMADRSAEDRGQLSWSRYRVAFSGQSASIRILGLPRL
jgi:hypothetical protein